MASRGCRWQVWFVMNLGCVRCVVCVVGGGVARAVVPLRRMVVGVRCGCCVCVEHRAGSCHLHGGMRVGCPRGMRCGTSRCGDGRSLELMGGEPAVALLVKGDCLVHC